MCCANAQTLADTFQIFCGEKEKDQEKAKLIRPSPASQEGPNNENYLILSITVRSMIESGRAPHDQGPS